MDKKTSNRQTPSVSKLVSLNPATGEPVGEVPVTSPEEIERCVERARDAQPAWAEMGIAGRGEAWLKIGEEIVKRAPQLAELLTREMGKPLRSAEAEIKDCGAEMARREKQISGSMPLSTLRAKISYGFTEALTPQGHIGIQVWINQGTYGDEIDGSDAKTGQASKGPKRSYKR